MLKKMFTLVVLFAMMVSVSVCYADEAETRIAEIRARYDLIKPFYSGETFDEQPLITAPYAPGVVNREYLTDGLNFLNFLRFIAGLPDDVTLSEDWIGISQKGAVLLAANNYMTHYPTQPNDMDDDFYFEGKRSTTSSNLSRRSSTAGVEKYPIRSALMGQASDENISNMIGVGHRRWLLNPDMLHTAFGVADNGNNRYITVYAHNIDREPAEEVVKYISWPASIAFPREFAGPNIPWSVQPNIYDFATPTLESVTVTLTRRSDGKIWEFNSSHNTPSTSGRYFNVDDTEYGGLEHPVCIIFRPEGITEYSGIYDVKISGLTDREGTTPKEISYSVEFFELDSELTDSPVSPTPNPSTPDNGGGGGSSGCNAGLGALALLFAIPLFISKTTKISKNMFLLSVITSLIIFPALAMAQVPNVPAQSFPVGSRIAGPPEHVGVMSYVSGNPDVAVINASGQVAIVGSGNVKIKAFDPTGKLVAILPLSIPKPDAATLNRQKALKGDYKPRSVYGPRLPQKQLNQLRARIDFLLHSYFPDPATMSDTDKIISVLSLLTLNCTYAPTWSKNYANTAWGSLVYGEGQCSAYARGFKALADAVNLPCYYVRGSEGPKEGRHQWVMVKCDGKWFHLEPQQMFNGNQIQVSKDGLKTALGTDRNSVPVTYLRAKFQPYENASKLPTPHNENYVVGINRNGKTFAVMIDEKLKRSLPLDPTMW